MADLLSELERFEEEMKELDTDPSNLNPSVALAPTSSSGAVVYASGPMNSFPPPPPPPPSALPGADGQAGSSYAYQQAPAGPTSSYLGPTSNSSQARPQNSSPYSSWQNPNPSSAPSQQQFNAPSYPPQQQYSYPQYQGTAPRPLSGIRPAPPARTGRDSAGMPAVISLPSQNLSEAQQLFQRDAACINPLALQQLKAALASGEGASKAEAKKRAVPRQAAGEKWEDPTLADFPENDHRLFCGDLGNEVNDDVLSKAFSRFPSFNMSRVVRDKRTGKTRGYGFVSFSDPLDLAAALKEMNGKYVGNRPVKLRKSTWKERVDTDAVNRHHKGNKRQRQKHIVMK